jgi:6-phosphofructokinase 2
MTDIITITLNPAIDKTYIVNELVPEHKLRCANPLTEAGGGGINVSKGLKEMGSSSLAVFFAGGRNGKHFEEILEHDHLEFKSIQINEETRESLIIIDQSSKKEFRIVVEGPVITFASFQEVISVVDDIKPTYIIASGSLPKGLPENVYTSLAKEAKLKGYKFILDSSGKALTEALSQGVYLMKPNLKELSNLVGVESISLENVPQAARQLIKEGKAEVLVVSMSSDGAMLITKDMHYHVHSPEIERKSTVGAGDSMVSGMVWALQQNKSLLEMVCWGVACGSAATMNTGTELFKKQDAEMLFNRIAEKVHW